MHGATKRGMQKTLLIDTVDKCGHMDNVVRSCPVKSCRFVLRQNET